MGGQRLGVVMWGSQEALGVEPEPRAGSPQDWLQIFAHCMKLWGSWGNCHLDAGHHSCRARPG